MPIEQITRPRPPLARLLRASTASRLHVAFALVGWAHLSARTVLSLHWTQVFLDERTILLPEGAVQIENRLVILLIAHGKRQRMDRWLAENA